MSPRPRRSKRLAMYVVGAGAVAIVAVFLLVYFVIFPTSSPKPFRLTTTPSATSTAGSSATTRTSSAGAGASAATGKLGGSWTVASGSQAGYRVREKLAFLPAESDAVGRTSQITGSALLRESAGRITIESASVEVAVNTLKSDRSMRDEKIHQIGLESDRYPTARFTLAAPLQIATGAVEGKVAQVTLVGTFQIHGAARRETLPVELTLSGNTLEAAGALTFPWGEFNMTAPSIGGFVNVTEKATLEFDLRLQRA